MGRNNRRGRARSNPGHESFRGFARVAGPLLCIAGLGCIIGGVVSFNREFDRHRAEFDRKWNENRSPIQDFPGRIEDPFERKRESKPPSDEGGKFWLFFMGVPLLGIGGILTKAGYFGAAASYVASESRPALETITRTVAESLRDADGSAGAGGGARAGIACPSCDAENDADARFCDACGQALARACPKCGDVAAADAKFCDECGTPLA